MRYEHAVYHWELLHIIIIRSLLRSVIIIIIKVQYTSMNTIIRKIYWCDIFGDKKKINYKILNGPERYVAFYCYCYNHYYFFVLIIRVHTYWYRVMPICVIEDSWAEYGYGCELDWWSPVGDPRSTDIAEDFL
jgi:hypothetical protein